MADEERVKPVFKSDFDLLPEGLHWFVTDKADVIEGEQAKDSVKMFKVESLIQGGDHDGARAFDNFPLVSKKNFGVARLAGFMIVIGLMKTTGKDGKPIEDYPISRFGTPEFAEGFKTAIPGKAFGGRVKHNKSKQDTMMANIVEYYTKAQFDEAVKAEAAKKGKGGGGKGAGTKETPAQEFGSFDD